MKTNNFGGIMGSPTFVTSMVHSLYKQYSTHDVAAYGGSGNHLVYSGSDIKTKWFIGSDRAVIMIASNSITNDSPACIAAPKVEMLAKKSITFGMNGLGHIPIPFRLYAPKQLTIKAKQVSMGDFQLIEHPKQGILYCEKLSLYKKRGEEDPSYFEVVKSWAKNDTMEVEVISSEQPFDRCLNSKL